jgi:glutamate-1-semialdehyde aminotransferase
MLRDATRAEPFRGARGAHLLAGDGARLLDLDNAGGAVILGHAEAGLARAMTRAFGEGYGPSAGPPLARLAARLEDRLPPGFAVFPCADGDAAAAAARAVAREATGIAAVVAAATPEEASPQLENLPGAAALVLDPAPQGAEEKALARRLADAAGALLVLDARAGFLRLGDDLRAADADLIVLGETLANGHPIGALAGPPALLARAPAVRGPDGLAAAAALAVLDRAERQDIPGGLAARGETLAQGLGCALAAAGVAAALQGPPARQTLRGEGPAGLRSALAREGVHWRGLIAPSLALSPLDLLEASAAFARALRGAGSVNPPGRGARA